MTHSNRCRGDMNESVGAGELHIRVNKYRGTKVVFKEADTMRSFGGRNAALKYGKMWAVTVKINSVK